MLVRRTFDLDAIRARHPLPDYCHQHGIELSGGANPRGRCPIHAGDNREAFSLFRKDGQWLWHCHTGDCGTGDVIALHRVLRGCDFATACRELGGETLPGEWLPRPALPPRSHDEDEEAARKRSLWPSLNRPSEADLQAIAALRRLPAEAVHLVGEAGFLKVAIVEGRRSFILAEGDFAQARRFDGQPFSRRDSSKIKAKNLPGSRGHFLGRSCLGKAGRTGPPPPVLIVEGAVGLVEAAAAAWMTGADADGWAVVAATSAQSRFDGVLLAALAGRRVRIVPDADEAGIAAAARWGAELSKAGCAVDGFRLPPGVKDIGGLVAAADSHREFLNNIFTL